jgi:hypothetical protein
MVRRRGLLVLAAMVPLAGCTPAQQPAALAAATTFQSALGAADTPRACALLSDEARGNLEAAAAASCPAALTRLALPDDEPATIEVWGTDAQVRTSGGVLFLAEFAAGWRVTAAGCQPRTDRPYDCRLEG